MKKTTTDQLGRSVTFDYPPKRIISLVPSQTELLLDLGLDEEIVGITKFCVHPIDIWAAKPHIGGTKKFQFDKIAELQPDLIIGNKEENDKNQIDQLAQHYPVWMSDIKTLEDALDMIVMLGEITGKQAKATAMAIRIHQSFTKMKESQTGKPKASVAFFIWKNPYMVAAADTFINTMLDAAGFINVFADKTRYPKVTLTEVADRQPDIILLSSEPFPFAETHFGEFKEECQQAAIKLVDGEMFSWYGSRMLKAAEYFVNLRKELLDG